MRYNQLVENKSIVYHGDNEGTTVLQAKWMMHDTSNNQEGVGIYFTPDINVATNYGAKVSSIDLTGLKIVNSRMATESVVSDEQGTALTRYLSENNEDFWYIYSDYGIEVAEPEDVEEYHHEMLYDKMKTSEIRYWQMELAQAADVITLVTGWNKFINIDALLDRPSMFYAVINTDIVATPVNDRKTNET